MSLLLNMNHQQMLEENLEFLWDKFLVVVKIKMVICRLEDINGYIKVIIMEIAINILLIATFCVFVIDLSGFIENMEEILSKWLGVKCKIPKPFSCSLCSSFWLSLIYIIVTGFSLPLLVYSIFIAYMTTIIRDIILLVKDIIVKIINRLYDWLKL